LSADPNLADAADAWRSGYREQAERLARAVADRDPRDADAHRLLQEILSSDNRVPEAIDAARRVIALAPRDVATHRRLAELLRRRGDIRGAVAMFERSLQMEPGNTRALNNLGNLLNMLDRTGEAIEVLSRAIALQPEYPAALVNLGIAFVRAGKLDLAIAQYQRALSLQPRFPEALLNLAGAHLRQGSPAPALAAFDAALRLAPSLVKAHVGRANALDALGRAAEAIDALHEAIRLDPADQQAYLNGGRMMLKLGNGTSALTAFEAVLALDGTNVLAKEGRAKALISVGRHEDALPALAELLEIAPQIPYLAGYLFHSQLHCCDWRKYHATRRDIQNRVLRGDRVNVPLSFLAHSDSSEAQRVCAEVYVAAEFTNVAAELTNPSPGGDPPQASCPRPRCADRSDGQHRIRLGYVSSDFRDHPVGQLIVGLIESHDRSRFETFGINTGLDDGGKLRPRLQRAFEHFEDLSTLSDPALTARIAALELDILVDLGGHTFASRSRALASRPAPVQVSFLGFPGTLGTGFIDYLIADRHVIPGEEQRHYSEQLIYLPDSCLPGEFSAALPATPGKTAAGLPEAGFVFCAFNAQYKITPDIFDSWMRVLHAVPHSVLWLREGSRASHENLAREAAARGVDPARLRYAVRAATPAEHQARFALADLYLDTTPYNAHTTAAEALAVAVPVITLPGRTFASRVATSLLHAVGLGQLSAADPAHYERLAIDLAHSPAELARLKEHLRRVRATAPLFDQRRFCRHIEAAFTHVLERHRQGLSAATFVVQT
jgi:predicted O-linked N-acetylglucosamine transferase (SPINDLY family)